MPGRPPTGAGLSPFAAAGFKREGFVAEFRPLAGQERDGPVGQDGRRVRGGRDLHPVIVVEQESPADLTVFGERLDRADRHNPAALLGLIAPRRLKNAIANPMEASSRNVAIGSFRRTLRAADPTSRSQTPTGFLRSASPDRTGGARRVWRRSRSGCGWVGSGSSVIYPVSRRGLESSMSCVVCCSACPRRQQHVRKPDGAGKCGCTSGTRSPVAGNGRGQRVCLVESMPASHARRAKATTFTKTTHGNGCVHIPFTCSRSQEGNKGRSGYARACLFHDFGCERVRSQNQNTNGLGERHPSVLGDVVRAHRFVLLTNRIVLLIDLFAAMSVNQRRARLTLNDKKEHQ